MGRSLNDDIDAKKTEENPAKESESPTDSDLEEEEFIVEKILKMRTTKKGKVQCKSTDFPPSSHSLLPCRSPQMERFFRY